MNQTPRNEPITTPPVRDIEDLASFTECTGILPAQIETAEQGEDISQLESIHPIQPRFIDGNDEQ